MTSDVSLTDTRVAAVRDPAAFYPEAPFSPGEQYPEYEHEIAPAGNPTYALVREALVSLRLDEARLGTAQWDPFGDFIRPGQVVVIKPNLVRNYHPFGMDARSIFTHASVVRPVLDYVLRAMRGSGRVVIADAPLQSCDFTDILRVSGLNELREYYHSRRRTDVSIVDLRLVRASRERSPLWGRMFEQHSLPGDPAGQVEVDLGQDSLLDPIADDFAKFRVTSYDRRGMESHHNRTRHSYVVGKTILSADVVINLPKMKTHQKAGVTGALKNFVGINCHKDCLPHHRKGSAVDGGDEYPSHNVWKSAYSALRDIRDLHPTPIVRKPLGALQRAAEVAGRRTSEPILMGSWSGNDTLWRTILDLNRLVLYATSSGEMATRPQRTVFNLVDGIIAGEDLGPLEPTPKHCGVVLAGLCGAAVDCVMCAIMGHDFHKFPSVARSFGSGFAYPIVNFSPEDIAIESNQPGWKSVLPADMKPALDFTMPPGWRTNPEGG